MQLFDPQLAEGPLGLILQHLHHTDRARLALTCRAGRRAALAAPVKKRLSANQARLPSLNTWLCRRIAAGAGAVQAAQVCSDPDGRAVLTACLLARCGTTSLSLCDPSAGLLEAACTISSLTHLDLIQAGTSLDPLGALPQLQSLSVIVYPPARKGPRAAPLEWRLPALTELGLCHMKPCSISLDGCSTVQRLRVSMASGLALTASRPLPQLTRLALWHPNDLAVPWQQLPALRELVLGGENGAGLLEGATHLISLSHLQVNCGDGFAVPPGAWLADVTRFLVLENFNCGEDPASLDWAASITGIDELVLWYANVNTFQDQHVPKAIKWVPWAAGLPHLRLVELRAGCDEEVDEANLLCSAVRTEGEGIRDMLFRLVLDLADAC